MLFSDLGAGLSQENAGVYLGIDPTAASLHVGHLIPLMAMYWLYALGCRAYLIVRHASPQGMYMD